MNITIKRLPSGYYHIRGQGPCNWTQPRNWPCDAGEIRSAAFPEASREFLAEVWRLAVLAFADPGEKP